MPVPTGLSGPATGGSWPATMSLAEPASLSIVSKAVSISGKFADSARMHQSAVPRGSGASSQQTYPGHLSSLGGSAKRCPTLRAELGRREILVLAPGTFSSPTPPRAGRGSGLATIARGLGRVNNRMPTPRDRTAGRTAEERSRENKNVPHSTYDKSKDQIVT